MTTKGPEPHTLVGAYALDALDAADRQSFESHLSVCRACTEELRTLREATARLAEAVAAPPPPDLQRHVEAAVARTRQLPPKPVRLPGPQRGALHRRRPVSARLVARAAIVVVGLASAAGIGYLVAPSTSPSARTADSQQVAEVLTAPDAVTMRMHVPTGGTATVVMSRREHAVMFAASGLRILPRSKCYELWIMGPGGTTSGEVLPAPTHGMTGPVVAAASMRSGQHLALTVEPNGGSSRPSGMLLTVAL
jgi:anti-sigma-K factor RskA